MRSKLDPAFAPAIEQVANRATERLRALRPGALRATAAGVIVEILERHDPRHLPSLVDSLKRHAGLAFHSVTLAARADVALRATDTMIEVDLGAAFALMTIHSGYAREHAVRMAPAPAGPFTLSLLVQRLNDWVPEVRLAAETRLAALEADIAPEVIAGALDYLTRFNTLERATQRGRDLVARLVCAPGVLDLMAAELMGAASPRTLRLAQSTLRTPRLDDRLNAIAASSRSFAVRALAVAALLQGEHRWKDAAGRHARVVDVRVDRDETARRALGDRSQQVQAIALAYVIAHGAHWSDRQDILLSFAGRPGLMLGGRARWELDALDVDWRAVLRERFTQAGDEKARLAMAIGAVGDADDGAMIWAHACGLSDAPALPFLAAAARLGQEEAARRLATIAADGKGMIAARRASRALIEARRPLDADTLGVVADRGDDFVRRGLRRHFGKLPLMQQLIVLARLERSGATISLRHWFAELLGKRHTAALLARDAELEMLRALCVDCPQVRASARTTFRLDV